MTASQFPAGPLHAAQRLYLAEDLVRMRPSHEQRRYTASQRSAKVDANPHQISAVVFALGRLREGGCILADEVGLGKTIEAGLVIAQLLAEGMRRVLLVAPKPLVGQWRQELSQLFGLDTRDGRPAPGGFDGSGIFLIGREAAGSEKGRAALLASEPFELCVIDEAHEMFANLYKRFDKLGTYQEESPHARTAGRVRDVLQRHGTPVLLLTATPIQNSLAELWGLVQYVDPLGTLLGDLPTFRALFCGDDDRQIASGQEEELRSRLRQVLQRTLRRQAQEFLEKPFVQRRARTFDYTMSPAERALYDDVTRYLLAPGTLAFEGRHGHLLLLMFHRQMASSTRALAASLRRVAERLRSKMTLDGRDARDTSDVRVASADLEDEDIIPEAEEDAVAPTASAARPPPSPEDLREELRRVEDFVRRCEELGSEDGKFRALLKALSFVLERGRSGAGAGKLLIFTESLTTQDYLRERLVESRLVREDEITVFRGDNDSPRTREAVLRWRNEAPGATAVTSPDIAMRLALVHEFRTRSKILISTEAGAKGLNLQFCDTLVNYDLPWNPQRIEQRIGRCHRYGQQHDVTVINFLAKDNEAQRLTFEILSQKLELFGTVLDASDQVLHKAEGPGGEVLTSAMGADFEVELRRVYERARTLEEMTAELRALRERVTENRKRFEETHARTASVIQERFDHDVQQVLRTHKEAVPAALAELDRDLSRLVLSYLDAQAIPYERARDNGSDVLRVLSSPALPAVLQAGVDAAVGAAKDIPSLHAGHPLVTAAVEHARAETRSFSAAVSLTSSSPSELRSHAGKRGRLRLMKAMFDGFEPIQLLVPVVVLEGGAVLDERAGTELLQQTMRPTATSAHRHVTDEEMEDAVEEVLFSVQARVDEEEHARFTRAAGQVERFIEDRLLTLRRQRATHVARLEEAESRRHGATSSEARTAAERTVLGAQRDIDAVETEIARLQRRDDDTFRTYQAHIERRRYAPPRLTTVFDMDLALE